MSEIELEKTYLAKELPDLTGVESVVIEDTYVPESDYHAVVRLRRRGDDYEITKKEVIDESDASRQTEQTISLTRMEFESLAASSEKSFTKRRYFVEIDGSSAEVDVYLGSLTGLVVIDFEFNTEEELDNFETPPSVLADVTQEEFVAGGYLAGKSYQDIVDDLERFDYQPLLLKGVNK